MQISQEVNLNKLIQSNLELLLNYEKKITQENEEEIKKEIENKRIKEEELKKLKENIEESRKKLIEKDLFIQRKNQQLSDLTNALENVYKKEQKRLQEEKEKIQKKLDVYKYNAIKQFLTIKIINEEIQKLTLNKDRTYSVIEIMDDLSLDKKFINSRQYFDEIVNEYEKIVKEIDNSKNPNQIYKRYDLNQEAIIKN